jgi:hypothetical protein
MPAPPDARAPAAQASTPTRRQLLCTAGGLTAGWAWSVQGEPKPEGTTWRVGPGRSHTTLGAALRQARDGDTIELDSGMYGGDVGVVTQSRLTLRGVGGVPVLDAQGRHAMGKGILVVTGGDVTVENLEFRGARVPHHNGAGIRLDGGRLAVRRCRFIDNQMGILTGNRTDIELHIEDSLFVQAPRDASALHHLLYVGRIGRFSVRGSRFENGWRGHLLKSRARHSVIEYNLIHDGPQGGASYEIDLPEGGQARIIGNVIGQSRQTQNAAVLSFGAEGGHWPRHALHLAHNTLVSNFAGLARFVEIWPDRLGSSPDVQVINNLAVGPGWLGPGLPGRHDGNWPALAVWFADAHAMDWRLPPGSVLRGAGVDPRQEPGPDLRPRAEFTWPLGTRALDADPVRWTPGAFQR